MAEPDKRSVTLEELLVSSLAQTDALEKLKSLCRRFQRNGRRISECYTRSNEVAQEDQLSSG